MGRLIDVDALKQDLRKYQIESLIAHNEEKNVFDIINEQPTAYDLEKVVAELKEKFDYYGKLAYENKCKGMVRTSERYKSSRNAFYRSINIVKRGGD